jgi:hypothetical protein
LNRQVAKHAKKIKKLCGRSALRGAISQDQKLDIVLEKAIGTSTDLLALLF